MTALGTPALVDALRGRLPDMLGALEALVDVESPSADPAAAAACADVLAEIGERLLGEPPARVRLEGRTHLRWAFGGAPRVLVLGHLDTVWPLGTLERWPFTVDDGIATGPGVFDMKAGLVQGLFGLATLDDLDGIALLVTADEELGSPTSRPLIEETARGAAAVLVLEPSAAGALKTARKGVAHYRVEVIGRAAHAGLEPERGLNALVELAHQVLAVTRMADPGSGTTVTPTVGQAGTAVNVVPGVAVFEVDVRAATREDQQHTDARMRALAPVTPGVSLRVTGGENKPPLDEEASAGLFAQARRVADRLGLPPLRTAAVGGGSDGNFTAGIGVPTLDGLGAVGDGAHAEGEHVVVADMPERAALVAALAADLREQR